jgi:hypothetical protein
MMVGVNDKGIGHFMGARKQKETEKGARVLIFLSRACSQ